MSGDLNFELGPTQFKFVTSESQIVMLMGPFGEGKCHKKGTKVIMFDGSLKKVEDVQVGDQLMGPDSKPRNIMALGSGRGELYTVNPYRGKPFTVNGEHVLSLRRTNKTNKHRGKPYRSPSVGLITNVSVLDYLKSSRTFRMYHKLYRVAVDFPAQRVLLDPYFLGAWLGDGDSHRAGITTMDPVIAGYMGGVASAMGVGCKNSNGSSGKATQYHFTIGNTGKPGHHPIMMVLRHYNLIRNKHIPMDYLCNDRAVRMEVLAGLIDTDGAKNSGTGYEITQKSKILANDIAFLARSLGCHVNVSPCMKGIKSRGFKGTYHRLHISGDILSELPLLLKRKKVRKRRPGARWQKTKDVLVSGIKSIKTEGVGQYYGFVLDGDHLYLLDDFTVTHNTYAGVAGAIAHAARCQRNIRGCLVRDTFQNIKTSTIPDIKEYLGPWVHFADGEKKMIIRCNPSVELDLFGIDDHASISKLQGPQYAFAWLEEPAPIFEKANAGLPREVFNLVLARAARQRDTIMRVQITQNPADDEHWTSLLAEEPEEYMVADDGTIIRKEVFVIPRGENIHLNPMARAATQAAFKDDPAKWARYVEGKIAAVYAGKPAVPAYNAAKHFSDRVIPVFKGEGLQFWDGWMHPCCILAQYRAIDSTGGPKQLVIHDVLYDEGVGTKELIREQIEPMLKTPKWKDKIRNWRVIGDPSMASPDQSSSKSSPRREIEDKFGVRFEAGPVSWHARQEPLNNAFKMGLNHGYETILLSRSAVRLHKALKGAWHYKIDNNGNIIGDKPIQNSPASHPGNALSYGIAVLMPYELRKEMKKVATMERQKRAMSYGNTNLRRAVPSTPPIPGMMR